MSDSANSAGSSPLSPVSVWTDGGQPLPNTEALLQQLPWGVVLLTAEGRVAVLNPAAATLWGLPATAILGYPPAQVQPRVLPADVVQVLTHAATAATPAASGDFWLPYTKQWIRLSTAPAPTGGGWVYWENHTASQAASQAAEQYHHAQQAASRLLAAVEEVAHTGSYEGDLATMTFHFSDGMYRLFGEAPQSFMPSLAFIDARSHPDDTATVQQVLTQATLYKQPYYYRRRIYRADGQLRTLESHGQVVCDAAGNAVQLLGLVQDVTERVQAEAEVLRAKEEQRRSLVLLQQAEAVAGLGSWYYDLATGCLHLSEGMYQLLGLPVGSAVSLGIYRELVVDEDLDRAEQLVHQLTAGTTDVEDTLRLRVGGQVKTVRIKAVVLREEGQPVRVLGVDLDISQLQHLEAENLRLRLSQQQALFEAVQQAEETERQRIAESLHNGVGQLLFATKLRLDMLHPPVLTTDSDLVATHREAAALLAEAIHQTRALSHELVPLVLKEFGLKAALQDVCRQLSTPRLRLRCSVTLDEQALPLPALLQLALYRMAQELGLNMVKHARGATEGSLELETTPSFVLLRAEDNGAGFASDPAASSGLGLRTIRDRVALLNGTLELGHHAGFGTFVRLRIPLPATPTA